MRRWHRRCFCHYGPFFGPWEFDFGGPRGFGFGGPRGFGFGRQFGPYPYRISKEEERGYLEDLKKEIDLELEEIKKRLDELK